MLLCGLTSLWSWRKALIEMRACSSDWNQLSFRPHVRHSPGWDFASITLVRLGGGRSPQGIDVGCGQLANLCCRRLRSLAARVATVIRVQAIWLSAQPMDMRAGMNTALGKAIAVFGNARPHLAYVCCNRRGDRLKVLIHDGVGLWLAGRQLHRGGFVRAALTSNMALTREQFDALVLGLPWQRIGHGSIITTL